MQSSANLVTQEKRMMNSHLTHMTEENVMEQNNFCGSGSSISAGASTILGKNRSIVLTHSCLSFFIEYSKIAASLEREAQLNQNHGDQKIGPGLLAGRNGPYRGRFFGSSANEIEHDSINNSEPAIKTYNSKDMSLANRMINKKLSWDGVTQQVC